MKKYRIIISNFYKNLKTIKKLIDIKKKSPQVFNENISQIILLGSFPYCLWDYTNIKKEIVKNEELEEILNFIIDNNLKLIFDFSNVRLEEKHFSDTYNNHVLNLVSDLNIDISAVVYNYSLATYIKNKYPKSKLIKSDIYKDITINLPFEYCLTDKITYLENEKDIIKNLNKYIIYINSFCENKYDCSYYKSNNILNFETDFNYICKNEKQTFEECKKNNLFISLEEMMELQTKKDFIFAVKSNANNPHELLECYIYYLIKPEFHNEVRLSILKNLYQ